MDNVTHTLTGLALSRAGFDRLCPRAVWLLIVSANAPDIDIVSAAKGGFRYLQVHRGYTHSLVGLPVMAVLSVLVVALIFRQKLPWLRAFLLCCIGVASHLLLDWTNSYGIRLLLPFSSRWLHLDINFLYDLWILLILGFAALWPLLSGLVSREIGGRSHPVGRAAAISALALVVLFDFARLGLHNRVIDQLESRLYDGRAALAFAALPDPFNPLRWTGIVETEASYRTGPVNPFGQWDPEQAATYYKPADTAILTAAESQEPFRFFLYFARFPVWSIQAVADERSNSVRLDLTDLRFGSPGRGSFHCIGFEDESLRLVFKRFTYDSGAELGWSAASPARAR